MIQNPHHHDDHHPGLPHGADLPGQAWVIDIEIPLQGQGQGQPVGGCVEQLWAALQEELKHEASDGGPVQGGVLAKGVGVEVPVIGCILFE